MNQNGMAEDPNTKPSFSASQRWMIFVSVITSIVAAVALVVMVNYLGARYHYRFILSNQAGAQLSPQTLAMLKTITNKVNVTIYFDRQNNLYGDVDELLKQYNEANSKISVDRVDYRLDAGKAQKIKETHRLSEGENKDLVIFECEGRSKIISSSLLEDIEIKQDGPTNYSRNLTGFEGEKWFSAAILNVVSPKARKAYFLEGHGEHPHDDEGEDGSKKFAMVLEDSNIRTSALSLFGTNEIPGDCNLLVIDGPRRTIPADEVEKIRAYLNQGHRLMVLFNAYTQNKRTGLEEVLAEWNVAVGFNIVKDPKNTANGFLIVNHFNREHAISTPLIGSELAMVSPRSIEVANPRLQGPEAPVVSQLAFSGEEAAAEGSLIPKGHNIPVIVAVEKGRVKGVLPDHGTTAIVVAGDSLFLNNTYIVAAANQDFAMFAANWLLDQTQLLEGIGPHPVKEYKLMLTNAELSSIRWLFLGAMPGGILLLGGLVWLNRRR
jgi:hypothetical protein